MHTHPTEPIELRLPSDIIASMEQAVESGQYHTPDEIATIALLEWQRRRQAAIEELRMLCEEGINSGIAPEESIESILAEAHRRYNQRHSS